MPWGQMESSMLKLFSLLATSSPENRCSTRNICASVKLDDHKQDSGSDLADIAEYILSPMWKTARRESAQSN